MRCFVAIFLGLLFAGAVYAQTPVTYGKPVRQGDLPNCGVPFVNGTQIISGNYQMDVKNRWPDGSIKFAIASYIDPAATSGTTDNVTWDDTGVACVNTGFLTSSQMLAAGFNFDAQIQLTGGSNPSASARTILTAANSAGGCVDPGTDPDGSTALCTYWMKGPVVTAVKLEDRSTRAYDMKTDANTGNPLHPYFIAYFFPSTNQVLVEYVLEDTWASTTAANSARDQTFSLVLTAGNTSPIILSGDWGTGSQTMITRSAFHRTYCASGANAGTRNTCNSLPAIDHNYGYLSRTQFFPNWDSNLLIDPRFPAITVAAFNNAGTIKALTGTRFGVGFFPGPDGCGASNRNNDGDGCSQGGFNNGGSAWFHGPLPTWDILALLSNDQPLINTVVYGNSDLGYEIPYFYREADTSAGHGQWFDAGNANSATPTAGTVGTQGRIVSINARTQVNLQDVTVQAGTCNSSYPNDWINFGGTGQDLGIWANGISGNAQGQQTGPSHWANLAYLSYLFTGEYGYYEEQILQSGYAQGMAGDYSPGSRACYQTSANGGLRMGAAGYWTTDQERSNDWTAREVMLGAFLAVDSSPEKTYLLDKVKTNIAVWEGAHNISPCDLGAGGVTYSYCTGSGFGTSQSAWSYGNTARISNSNQGGTAIGQWAEGPSIGTSGGYSVQYPWCFQTTGSGVSGSLVSNLTAGGLATAVSAPAWVNGSCPTTANATAPDGANSIFQTAYSTTVLGWINDLGFCPGSCQVLQYVGNFWINLFQNPAANKFLGSGYVHPSLDVNGAQFTNWAAANASSLYSTIGGTLQSPTGWIAAQGSNGFCPSGTSGSADEWYIAEAMSATSYVYGLTETFSGNNYTGANAYNTARNSSVIQLCMPYFGGQYSATAGLASPYAVNGNFGSPKWDIVPRTSVQGSLVGNGLIDNTRMSSGTGGLGTNGWTQAGVQTGNPSTGSLPSASYTQCGPTIAAGATPAAIQTALNACSANQFILLGAGTFNYPANTGTIIRSNKVVRGSGADQTFIVAASGAGNSIGCQISALFCIQGTSAGDFVPLGGTNWTAGFAQGSNQITLASIPTGLAAGSMILLDQCSDGLTGSPCAPESAEGPDNGNFFDCNIVQVAPWSNTQTYVNANAVTYSVTGHWYTVVTNSAPPAGTAPPATGSSTFWTDQGVAPLGTFGCAVNGDDRGNQRLFRPQTEVFLVTSVTGNVVTLNGSLKNPNWALSHTPQVVLLGPPAVNSGVENLSIDMTATGSNGAAAVMILDAANSWARGVKVVKAGYAAFRVYEGAHYTFQDNYVYGTTRPPGKDSDAFVVTASSDGLIQNNIAQYLQVFFLAEGGDTGTVIGHNFMVNNFNGNNNGINEAIFPHGGDHYELYEGNCINSYYGETLHGPKLMNTLFRNCIWGWESGANWPTPVAKITGTQSVFNTAYSRYHNIIGNVFGTPGYHNAYQASTATSIISLGSGKVSSAGATIPSDPVVAATTYSYGNYNTPQAATRWCLNSSSTGWVSICSSTSEVPTGFSPFGQPAPTVGDTGAGQSKLPASLYLAVNPSWYGLLPFPAIGPDVTGGNVGQCTGTLNTVGQFAGVAATTASQCVGTSINMSAWGGHINTNAAMNCFLNVMAGPPDGSNTAPLTFNADTCYTNLKPIATFTPSSVNVGLVPVGQTSNPVSVILKNTGSANLTNISITLNNSLFTIINNTCGLPATITNSVPGTGFTLAVNSTCTFQVTATPTAAAPTTANSIFTENTSSGSDTLVLNATGTGNPALSIAILAGNIIIKGAAQAQ